MHILADVDDGDAVSRRGSNTNRWQHCVLVLFTSEASQIDHAQVVDVLSGTSAAAVVVHAMPAFDVSGEWSGADGVEESPRPGTGRRDYKVRSEEERERGRGTQRPKC